MIMAEQTDSEHTGAEVCDGLWNQPVIASLESYCLGGFRVGGQQVHGTTHTHARTHRQTERQTNESAGASGAQWRGVPSDNVKSSN